jgi:hypothetical protein
MVALAYIAQVAFVTQIAFVALFLFRPVVSFAKFQTFPDKKKPWIIVSNNNE